MKHRDQIEGEEEGGFHSGMTWMCWGRERVFKGFGSEWKRRNQMDHQALVCPLRKQHCTTKGVLDLNQWMHLCVMWWAVVKSSTRSWQRKSGQRIRIHKHQVLEFKPYQPFYTVGIRVWSQGLYWELWDCSTRHPTQHEEDVSYIMNDEVKSRVVFICFNKLMKISQC